MSVPPVDGYSLVKVDMRMSKNAKIALAAVVIMGLAFLVIVGIAVAGVNGIGPMSRACGVIALAVTVPVLLLTIALASVMKTLTLSKEQKSFKKLQKLFYDHRSECKKKANQLKHKFKVKGSFIGFSTSFPNPHGLSSETVELLEEYMHILPSMHSRLLQLVEHNKGVKDDYIMTIYKECMEVANLVRGFAIMSAIGVEKGVVDLSVLSGMRNPQLNSLGLLMYYPEAVRECFERDFELLDPAAAKKSTRGFTELEVIDVLGNHENNKAITSPEMDSIRDNSLIKLEKLLLVIDETSKTVDKFDDSYLMHLARNIMPVKSPEEYKCAMNLVLSSLLYREVCGYTLEKIPEGLVFK